MAGQFWKFQYGYGNLWGPSMSMQILSIVLYSHDGRRRIVKLSPGVVNIITGASKTGKSALIDVVDARLSSTGNWAPRPARCWLPWPPNNGKFQPISAGLKPVLFMARVVN